MNEQNEGVRLGKIIDSGEHPPTIAKPRKNQSECIQFGTLLC